MPWRGPSYEGEYPTAGYHALAWVEQNLVIPDGPRAGAPLVATKEQALLTLRMLRVTTPRRGAPRYVCRLCQMQWPKGMGKSPWAAALAWWAAKGEAIPDGWDADGELVCRPHPSPWIQIAAVAEDQTANTWLALLGMARPEEGAPLVGHYPDVDLGDTRINVRRGKLEAVTSRAGTREGQRVTFGILDETEHWLPHTGGRKLSAVIRRNVAKMDGLVLETCNAPQIGAGSVAEIHMAQPDAHGILIDRRTTSIRVPDLTKTRTLKRALRDLYGTSATEAGGHVNLDRIVDECQDPTNDESESRRYYLNDPEAHASDLYFTIADLDARVDAERQPKPGEPITLGFDGAKWFDATVLYGCTADGHLWPLGWWERPEIGDDWEVDALDVDATVDEAMSRYHVVRFYADPPYWQDWVDVWADRYGRDVVREWWTNRPKAMHHALERIKNAAKATEAAMTWDGDTRARAHFANAHKRGTRTYVTIQKEHPQSARHIDGAMAATLAYEARGDALAAGEMKRKRTYATRGF